MLKLPTHSGFHDLFLNYITFKGDKSLIVHSSSWSNLDVLCSPHHALFRECDMLFITPCFVSAVWHVVHHTMLCSGSVTCCSPHHICSGSVTCCSPHHALFRQCDMLFTTPCFVPAVWHVVHHTMLCFGSVACCSPHHALFRQCDMLFTTPCFVPEVWHVFVFHLIT
jgi:hypothetical protein